MCLQGDYKGVYTGEGFTRVSIHVTYSRQQHGLAAQFIGVNNATLVYGRWNEFLGPGPFHPYQGLYLHLLHRCWWAIHSHSMIDNKHRNRADSKGAQNILNIVLDD